MEKHAMLVCSNCYLAFKMDAVAQADQKIHGTQYYKHEVVVIVFV